jgi:hypothetical protein
VSVRSLGLVLVLALAPACTSPPARLVDRGVASDLAEGGSAGALEVEVVFDRSFGEEGETPAHLVVAGERFLAVTERAVYSLDADARVLARTALPAASSGQIARLSSARWDETGLGAAVLWGKDQALSTGLYFALADAKGAFTASKMRALSSRAAAARGDYDGGAHRVVLAESRSGAASPPPVDLRIAEIPRSGSASAPRALVSGLGAGTALGGFASRSGAVSLCTLDPDGQVRLRRISSAGVAASPVELVEQGRRATGSCQLAAGGSTTLVAFTLRALAPDRLDAGGGDAGRAHDLGPGTLAYDVPVIQIVDSAGSPLAAPLRATLRDGVASVEDVLWDGYRYLVLVDPASYRGGRASLTLVDEAGTLLARDLDVPVDYDPARFIAGRLVSTDSDYALLFALQLPWDSGILHLARFRLTGL